LPEVRGLDDNRAILRRLDEQRGERGQQIPRLRVDPDHPRAPEHRNCIGLIGKKARIERDSVAFEPYEAQRVGIALEGIERDRPRTLMSESLVKPVNEKKTEVFWRPSNKCVRVGILDDAHLVLLARLSDGRP